MAMDSDELEDPRQFPLISTWLMELDDGPHADDQNYFQYWPYIEGDGYKWISELADSVTDKELQTGCPGMSKAIAKNVIQYAKVDTYRIRKALKKL